MPRAVNIGTALGVLATGTGAIASQLPGLSFFTSNSPPSFGVIGLMTSGLTLAIFVWVIATTPPDRDRSRAGLLAVCAAVGLGVVYVGLLTWTTVTPPPESGMTQRFQTGFGLSSFSLTDKGQALLKASPDSTAQELMLMVGGFRPGGPLLLWKPWTVTISWVLLGIAFLLAYTAWSYGLACVATRLIKTGKQGDSPSGQG